MASKTVPSGGLSTALNPSARLQQLLRQDSPPAGIPLAEEEAPEETRALNTGDAGSSIDDLSNSLSNSLSKQVSKSVSKPSSNSSTKRGIKAPQDPTDGDQGKSAAKVSDKPSARRQLLLQSSKEHVTRLSIDVPDSMYHRIKRYVLDQKIESIRALTLALYEDLLTEEGY